MKGISLYSGADNLGDGVIAAGHEIKIAVEYYPENTKLSSDACETIRLNHPDIEVIHKPVGEILSTLPKADFVIGGPPCPEFSNANTDKDIEKGMCEVRNFMNAVEITGAKYYLMENVPGLYKHHKGKSYLINMADYGVPQTRIRRIFTNLELPTPTHAEFPSQRLFGDPLKKWVSVREALDLSQDYQVLEDRKTVFGDYPTEENDSEFRKYDLDKPSITLHTDPRLFISATGFSKSNHELKTRSVDEPSDMIVVANEMRITDYPIKSEKKIRNRVVNVNDLKKKNPTWYDKHPPQELNKPSSTILAKVRGLPNEYISDGKYARKIVNEELAILQGFRPDFKFHGNKSSVKRQIGNAVPAVIGRRFFDQIKS